MTIREFLQMATDTTEKIVLYNYDNDEGYFDGYVFELLDETEENPDSELSHIVNSELRL